jgi:hypothetical protein
VVGDTQVSETTIQTQAAQVLDEHTDLASLGASGEMQVSRSVATNAVRHQLAQVAAAENGITVDEAQVSSTLASIGDNLASVASTLQVPQADVDDFIRDLAVLQALLAKAPEGGADVEDPTVTLDYVTASSRDEAVTMRARYVSDPSAMDADIAAGGTDASGSATAGKGTQVSLMKNPGLASSGIFAAEKGDVLIVPSGDQTLVVRVTDRTVTKEKLTSETLPTDNVVNIVTVLSLLLQPYAAQAGVQVNPRYGVWDQSSMQVVPGDFGV